MSTSSDDGCCASGSCEACRPAEQRAALIAPVVGGSEATPRERAQMLRVVARSPRLDDALTLNLAADLIDELAVEVEALEQRIADIAEAGLFDAETHRHRVEALESRIAAALEITDGMCSMDRHFGMTIEGRGEVIRAALAATPDHFGDAATVAPYPNSVTTPKKLIHNKETNDV